MTPERVVFDIGEDFFNDGHWYVLTSRSLGGLSPAELSDALSGGDTTRIREQMERGVCLPLAFDADCALDSRTRIVVGKLTDEEEAEWVARVRAPLVLEDGEFALLGAAMPENFEDMQEHSPDSEGHVLFDVEPGRYVVEVYAFVGSYTVNELWASVEDDNAESPESAPSTLRLISWWEATRAGQPLPSWLKGWRQDGYVDSDSDEHELLAYVIRLIPSDEDVAIPPQDEGYEGWVTAFDEREPQACPRGIPFKPSDNT